MQAPRRHVRQNYEDISISINTVYEIVAYLTDVNELAVLAWHELSAVRICRSFAGSLGLMHVP